MKKQRNWPNTREQKNTRKRLVHLERTKTNWHRGKGACRLNTLGEGGHRCNTLGWRKQSQEQETHEDRRWNLKREGELSDTKINQSILQPSKKTEKYDLA